MAAFPGGGNALRFPDQPTGQYGTNNTQQLAGVTTADWRLFFGDPKARRAQGPARPAVCRRNARPHAGADRHQRLWPVQARELRAAGARANATAQRAHGCARRRAAAGRPTGRVAGTQDAYKGSLPYMTNLIITLVTDEDMWPTKIALPFRLTEGEMEIVWDEIIFNNSLLGPVPEEGVSRLVTQQARCHTTRHYTNTLRRMAFARAGERAARPLRALRAGADAGARLHAHGQGAHVLPHEPGADPQRHPRDGVHRRAGGVPGVQAARRRRLRQVPLPADRLAPRQRARPGG